MRGSYNRPHRDGLGVAPRARTQRGFSLIELLVAIVLAGIIFAAMVPFFANALKRTSGDGARITANNIAQDRIEQVRLLSFNSITQPNLTAPPTPFGDGKFGPVYTVAGSGVPYTITYVVNPTVNPTPAAVQKKVTVRVTRSGMGYTTEMSTIVKNPDPTVTSATSTIPGPGATITGLSITASFKNWNQVGTNGVTVRRVQTNVTPNVTVTPTPVRQIPNALNTTVTWTGLTGGTAFAYTVSCHSSATGQTYTSPVFHLLKNARLKFDTNPGGG